MFLQNDRLSQNDEQERFSLLYLDEGESYLDDFSVEYIIHEEKTTGRLKRCTKSLIFVPDRPYKPIIKFPYANITRIAERSQGGGFIIHTKLMILMNDGGLHVPYKFQRGVFNSIFQLKYVHVNEFKRQIEDLHKINVSAKGFLKDEKLEKYMHELESKGKFDTSWLESLSETIRYESRAKKITPLVEVGGIILLTDEMLYFQPLAKFAGSPVEKVHLSNIKRVIPRRYLHRHVALEVFEGEMSSLLFSFESEETRTEFHSILLREGPKLAESDSVESHMMRWKRREISNFDYLMFLNFSADRTFNDLTQYPVFPWIIMDYKSDELNLEDASIYRDLSKPIGALNEKRLEEYQKRYAEMPEPKFLYGTHYSTPGFVLYYLIRLVPQYMLRLQNGKFDNANRIFRSIDETCRSIITTMADVKELIPEFYLGGGDFLTNNTRLDFGKRQDGSSINDVELPKWAKTPKEFIEMNRKALESEYVSENLNGWIDLIFGYKQRGSEAIKANNLFYHLTYEGEVNIDTISDPAQRRAYIAQISEFGQIPKQLFTSPHPRRSPISSAFANDTVAVGGSGAGGKEKNLGVLLTDLQNGLEIVCRKKLHKAELTDFTVDFMQDGKPAIMSASKDCTLSIYLPIEGKRLRSVNVSSIVLSACILTPDKENVILSSWDNSLYVYSIVVGRTKDTLRNAHEDAVSALFMCPEGYRLISASWDGTVRVWKYDNKARKIGVVPLAEFIDHESEVISLAVLSGDETEYVAAGANDGKIIIWDLSDYSMVNMLSDCHDGPITGLEYLKLSLLTSGNGRAISGSWLISVSLDGILRVYNEDMSDLLNVLNCGEPLTALCVIPGGTSAAIGTEEGNLILVDLKTCKEMSRLDNLMDTPIVKIRFSQNSEKTESILGVGGEDSEVVFFRIK